MPSDELRDAVAAVERTLSEDFLTDVEFCAKVVRQASLASSDWRKYGAPTRRVIEAVAELRTVIDAVPTLLAALDAERARAQRAEAAIERIKQCNRPEGPCQHCMKIADAATATEGGAG